MYCVLQHYRARVSLITSFLGIRWPMFSLSTTLPFTFVSHVTFFPQCYSVDLWCWMEKYWLSQCYNWFYNNNNYCGYFYCRNVINAKTCQSGNPTAQLLGSCPIQGPKYHSVLQYSFTAVLKSVSWLEVLKPYWGSNFQKERIRSLRNYLPKVMLRYIAKESLNKMAPPKKYAANKLHRLRLTHNQSNLW